MPEKGKPFPITWVKVSFTEAVVPANSSSTGVAPAKSSQNVT
jgi:hypothetical protein